MIKSTKFWGPCACDRCGKNIVAGDELSIVQGLLYINGHETRGIFDNPAEMIDDIDTPDEMIDQDDILDAVDELEPINRLEYAGNQEFVDLPMFDSDTSEQLSLF